MKNVKEITLSVDKGNPVTVYAKQGDHKTRFIKVKLLCGNEPYKMVQGETVVFRYLKPDGKSGMNKVSIDKGGDIIIELTDQVLAVSGCVYADVAILSDDAVLSSASFNIQSAAVPASENQLESSNDFAYLRELGTLTKETLEKSELNAKIAEDKAKEIKDVAEGLKKQPGYFSPEIGVNKWNSALNTNEMLVNQNTGTIYYCDFMCTSDYIDVSMYKGKKISIYVCNKNGIYSEDYFRLAFYDENKKYVSGINNNPQQVKATHIVSVPLNASYVRVSATNNPRNSGYYMLVEGEEIIEGKHYEVLEYKIADTREKANRNEKDIAELKFDNVSRTLEFGINRLDTTKVKNGYIVNTKTGEIMHTGQNYNGVSDFIPVKAGEEIFFAVNNSMDNAFSYVTKQDYAFYNSEKKFITGAKTPGEDMPSQFIKVPDKAKYAIFHTGAINGTQKHFIIGSKKDFPTIGSVHTLYEPYSEPKRVIPNEYLSEKNIKSVSSGWKGKTALFYGDSITAMGNNGGACWQDLAANSLSLAKYYVMGIGGQTYKKNNKPWFANPDGTYFSRNDNADMTKPSDFTVPEGKTAHYGYFASWDRISTMINDEIKDKIDLIFIFGINDGSLTESMPIPEFIKGSSLDSQWMKASENIFGGDYDINTLNGAIASTLMKLQLRCPNAIIVTGTSWSGIAASDKPYNTPSYSDTGMRIRNEGRIVKEISEFYSIPCVDIWANTGVNPWNREKYLSDMFHPYKLEGKKMLARAVVSGLKTINPRF